MDALCEPLPDGLSSCWDWQWATDPIRIPCPDLCTPGRRLARVLSATAAKLFASFLPQHALKLHIDQAPASDAALTAHYELRRLQEALPPPPTTTQFLSFPNLIQLPDTAGIWVIPTIVIIWTIVAAIMIWLALKKRGDPMSVIVFPDYLLPDYMLPELMTAGPVEVQGTGPSLASGPSTVHRVESLPQSSLSLARGSSMQVSQGSYPPHMHHSRLIRSAHQPTCACSAQHLHTRSMHMMTTQIARSQRGGCPGPWHAIGTAWALHVGMYGCVRLCACVCVCVAPANVGHKQSPSSFQWIHR